MSDGTKIEWSDATWSPIIGCDRVSPGCDNCYAVTSAYIRANNPNPKVAAAFEGLTHRTSGGLDWTGRVNLLSDRLMQPLRWRKPRKIFVNSQSDLFHDAVPDEFIAQILAVMALTPWHTYLVLTKRHGRMRSFLANPPKSDNGEYETSVGWLPGAGAKWMVADALEGISQSPDVRLTEEQWALVKRPGARLEWPLPNLWLGVSIENQKWADIRLPALAATPAAVRWASIEPLLGPIDLGVDDPHVGHDSDTIHGDPHQRICLDCSDPDNGIEVPYWRRDPQPDLLDWVVVGGESGPGARRMDLAWARDLRDQCARAKVPFFFKQLGSALARELGCTDRKGGTPSEWPEPFPREYPGGAA